MSWTGPDFTDTGTSVDPDDTPVGLAQAVDATIDSAQCALADGNVAQANDLLTAGAAVADALIVSLGGTDAPDADDMGDGS